MTALALWGPVAAWMLAIFVVSGMAAPPAMPGGLSYGAGHALGYGLLAALAARALAGGRWDGVRWGTLAGAWMIAAAYGVSDEWHQSFVPGRTADRADLVADATGAAAALALVAAWGAVRARRRPAGAPENREV